MSLQSALFAKRSEETSSQCDVCGSDPRVLLCGCGWSRPASAPEIQDRDLTYPLDYVVKNLPGLEGRDREIFDDWFELFSGAGVDFDLARRAAFARTLRSRNP